MAAGTAGQSAGQLKVTLLGIARGNIEDRRSQRAVHGRAETQRRITPLYAQHFPMGVQQVGGFVLPCR